MSHDEEMADATGGAEANGEEVVIGKQRLTLVWMDKFTYHVKETILTQRQLRGSTDTAASFAFENEDHTLGNALRYMISKK